MIKRILDSEGPVIGFLDQLGQLIALSVLWILGCIPLVTIGTSTAALYYAVIKSVRRGQGSAVQEFRRCYRENLGRGIAVTLTAAAAGALLALNFRILQGQENSLLSGGTLILAGLLLFACVYTGPVLSRFRLKVSEVWKLSFVMSLRFLPYTLLLVFAAAAAAALQIFVLPIPAAAVLPGVCCYLATYAVEPALRGFMPEKEEHDNAWYYET